MHNKSAIVAACLILTVLCGLGAIAIAIVASIYPIGEANTIIMPVLTTLVTLFGLGASAFFFKGLGG